MPVAGLLGTGIPTGWDNSTRAEGCQEDAKPVQVGKRQNQRPIRPEQRPNRMVSRPNLSIQRPNRPTGDLRAPMVGRDVAPGGNAGARQALALAVATFATRRPATTKPVASTGSGVRGARSTRTAAAGLSAMRQVGIGLGRSWRTQVPVM